MMNTSNKKTVKGFTIVELVIVVAIITILLGVLAPSLMTTYHKGRINSANADAKMIYNAVQTEVIRYMSVDRCSSGSPSGFNGTVWISYDPSAGVKFSTQPDLETVAGLASAANTDVAYVVATRVNQVVAGAKDCNWAVCVNNYIVKSSVSSNGSSSKCIGYYSANKAHAEKYDSGIYSSRFLTILKERNTDYNVAVKRNGSSASGDVSDNEPNKPVD